MAVEFYSFSWLLNITNHLSINNLWKKKLITAAANIVTNDWRRCVHIGQITKENVFIYDLIIKLSTVTQEWFDILGK